MIQSNVRFQCGDDLVEDRVGYYNGHNKCAMTYDRLSIDYQHYLIQLCCIQRILLLVLIYCLCCAPISITLISVWWWLQGLTPADWHPVICPVV